MAQHRALPESARLDPAQKIRHYQELEKRPRRRSPAIVDAVNTPRRALMNDQRRDWDEQDFAKLRISQSAFFDPQWYLNQYPDISAGGLDPAWHYLHYGGAEGRNPGPNFDTKKYASRIPASQAGKNPLLHFLEDGIPDLPVLDPDILARQLDAWGVNLAEEVQLCAQEPKRVAKGPLAVFVTHDANVGGAPAILASIADWFSRHTDYRVRIVSMAGGGWVNRFEAIAPTHVVGSNRIEAGRVKACRTALAEFLGEEPAFTFMNSVASGDYCKIDPYNAPRFGYVHELPQIIDIFSEQTSRLRDGSTHVFCDGIPVFDALKHHAGCPEEKLSIRESFIDMAEISEFSGPEEKKRARAKLGWDSETPIVMGCGVVHWRKQPEVFVRAAARLGKKARFVWIGDGEDTREMRALAERLGVSDRVEFLGYRDDYRSLLRCADLFALPSLEDPFPLVCLEAAAAGAPSVIFREAGGMVSFVAPEGEPPAGRAVTLGDEGAFCEALEELLEDGAMRAELARTAYCRVQTRHSTDYACMEILAGIRRVAGLRPKVSVLVPAYNSEPYLKERLNSIASQTFRDIEIVLRDDCSRDGSVSILERFAQSHPLARVEKATENSGSVFNAWDKCIAAARGELIWIAEADDSCEASFLEHMIIAFEPSGVRLVQGRSVPVNEHGTVIEDYRENYLHQICPGHWNASYCIPAKHEIDAALGRGNSIPNASGVVIRRTAALRAISVARQFRLAGDWAFYVTAIHGGRVGYAVDAVNYHRRHNATVTGSLEGTDVYFDELADVSALIRHLYGERPDRDRAFRDLLEREARRFDRPGPLPEGRLPEGAAGIGRAPALLFGVGDLSGGGAQMFAVRLVNGWIQAGAPAVLFLAGHEAEHPAVRAALSPEVPVIDAETIGRSGLARFMADWGLDVVATGHWWADRQVGKWLEAEVEAGQEVPPWAIVMHGCYENVMDHPDAFPDRQEVFGRAERYCRQWIWTADKNRRLFDEKHVQPKSIDHIVNGFDPVAPSGLERTTLGIPEDALVFTLASRAIPEKGWLATLEAFQAVGPGTAGRETHLILIGDGPAAQEIAAMGPIPGLHLVSHTSRLADYIALSDVGLLPSWFAGESLPLVLLEFLAQGKPVIVSDIGMCAWIIDAECGEEAAGIVLQRRPDTGKVDPTELTAAMNQFIVEPELADAKRLAARKAFTKFEFSRMLSSYQRVFHKMIEKKDRYYSEVA